MVLLNGHLGAGKSTISRGFVRAACRDPHLDVPSPTFLLCLTYKEDLGHDPEARQHQLSASSGASRDARAEGGQIASVKPEGGAEDSDEAKAVQPMVTAAGSATAAAVAPAVHHMDPYRLGAKVDKMSGLIDWEPAFQNDVCLIEWPDRMPKGECTRCPRVRWKERILV